MIWIFSDIYHPAVSGVPTTLDYLASVLSHAGHSVGMVTVGRQGPLSEPSVNYICLPTTNSLTFTDDQFAHFSARRICLQVPNSPEDVFIIATPGRVGLTGLTLARRRNRPSIVLHLSDVLRYSKYYRSLLAVSAALPKALYLLRYCGSDLLASRQLRFPRLPSKDVNGERFSALLVEAVRLVYGLATKIVVLSEKSAADLSEIVGLSERDLVRIPSGFLTPTSWDMQSGACLQRTRTLDGEFNLLYVGRLVPEKSIETLIHALALARKRGVPATLKLVGKGHAETKLRTLVSGLGLQAVVRFTGVVERADLDRIYCDADLLVFPSLTDTQGLVWLEAAILGLPTLYLDPAISTLPAIEPALTVERASPEALADRLTLLSQRRGFLRSVGMQLPEQAKGMLADVSNRWCDLVASLVASHREFPT